MPLARVPQNQIDALPVVTIESVGDPGQTVVIGKTLVRYWPPAQTGINGQSSNVADPRTAGRVYLLSNYLDFSGCTIFSCLLGVKITAIGGDGAQTWNVHPLPLVSTVDGAIDPVPDLPGPSNRNLTGSYAVTAIPTVGTLIFPALSPPAFPAYEFARMQFANNLGTVRLLFTATTGRDPALNFLTVWASSS